MIDNGIVDSFSSPDLMAMTRIIPINSKQSPSLSVGNIFRFILLIPFIFMAVASPSPALADNGSYNILILNSYHVGYKWSDEIYQGIMDELRPLSPSVDFHLEYMDMKRHYSEDRFASLFHSFSEKYKNITIDYILATDDVAFIFLKKYLPDLFPEATVIFCGTNYLEEKDIAGLERFYGITEKADIEATFELMFAIHPDVENVVIINDQTITGQKVAPYISEAIRKYQPQTTFSHLGNLSMKELLQRVATLPPQSLIFYTFFFRDADGETFEYDQSISLIAEASAVPIYGAWDFNLGLGIVGGMLSSGYHQGKAAAKLAGRFLRGDIQSPPPRLSESPNRYMFDYTSLQRFGIPVNKLPEDSILINKPETFVEKHKRVLLFSAIFIGLLFSIIAILIINIMQRKRVERDLRQSERNFRGIFENAIEGLFQASLDGRFLKVNNSLAKILKCDSPEEVLKSYRDLKRDLYVNRNRHNHITKQVQESGSAQLETELLCRDGSRVTALLYCRNVVDEKGRHLYLEGSITDMTEYKMTQETIIQTEKMLTLGGISAGIAHEIKNPLTSMMQAANIIANRLLHDSDKNRQCAAETDIPLDALTRYLKSREIPRLLTNLVESGNRANIIVDDMLSFSKKTIGEFSFEPLENIVRETVEMAKKDYSLRRGYSFAKIHITYNIADNTPPLYCSRSKLLQVLFNIFKNSAEAMAEAGIKNPEITCGIEYDKDTIRLEISDNGPGMDQKVKEKIFEPFYSTKGRKKGTGLGLSIAYYIITENHKGHMSVESAPNEGAKFIIRFPRRDKGAASPT